MLFRSGDVVKQGEYKGIQYYMSDRYMNDNMSVNDIHKFIDDYENINKKIKKIIGEDISKPLSKIFVIEWRDVGANDVVDILDDSMVIKTIEGNFPYLEEVILPGIISENLQHNNSSLEYLAIENLYGKRALFPRFLFIRINILSFSLLYYPFLL